MAPDTRYYYSVGTATQTLAGADSEHFFETAPATGTAQFMRIWVLGDSGTNNSNARNVRDAYLGYIGSNKADVLLMLGDNAYNDGTDSQYQGAVFDTYPSILRNTPLWSALGNHDGHSANSNTESGPYYDIFSFPRNGEAGGVASGTEAYYSFDYGNIHFISLDSYETNRSPSGAMLTWLQQDLANSTQDWIIAFWHHPPYSKGSHDSDSESRLIDMRENALPILEDYGVDLILSGHSHAYERSYLLDGHYGFSNSLTGAMILDGGDGSDAGDGAYSKLANIPHDGSVYVVAGSSGQTSGGSLNHPAMYRSLNNLGSMVIDITGNRLDAVFLRENGSTPDNFTIIKGADIFPPQISSASAISSMSVDVVFSEAVDPLSAENLSNYSIDGGVTISTAVLQSDNRTVRLSTSTLAQNQTYTVTASGIDDLNGNTMGTDNASFQWQNQQAISFQNGVAPTSGYIGTTDTYIAEGSSSNSNFGNNTELLIDGDDGGGDDLSSLIRWETSSLPPGTIVDVAAITLQVFNPSGNSYQVYALERAWIESQVTWNQADNSTNWQSAGADGSNDRGIQSLGTVSAGSTGSVTINLNAAGLMAVQQWINDPSSNHGVIIANTSAADGIDFRASEYGTELARPKLLLSYHAGVVDNTPPTVPDNLGVTGVTTNSASINWNASTDNVAVQNYRIFRDGPQVATVNGTSFIDTGLSSGTNYAYEVSAVDTSGNESARSAPITATTDTIPPDAITVQEARYSSSKNELKVKATSSEQPAAELTVYGPTGNNLGIMTYKRDKYELKLRPAPVPIPWQVTIVSTFGGIVTVPVVGAPPPPTPGKATSPDPANAATFVSSAPTLSWAPGGNTDSVVVYFGTNSNPPQVASQSGTSYTPGTLADNTTYYWRIDAVNGNGTTTGDEWSFATAPPPGPPGPATNPSPADNAVNVSTNAMLNWGAAFDADSYDLYFGTSPNPTFVGNLTATNYDPGTLATDTTYYWRLDPVNNLGTTLGQTWHFETQPAIPADTIVITKAEWKASRSELKVEATSSNQPTAILTLQGFSTMTFKKNKYLYKNKPVANPGSVTVISDHGGSATNGILLDQNHQIYITI